MRSVGPERNRSERESRYLWIIAYMHLSGGRDRPVIEPTLPRTRGKRAAPAPLAEALTDALEGSLPESIRARGRKLVAAEPWGARIDRA